MSFIWSPLYFLVRVTHFYSYFCVIYTSMLSFKKLTKIVIFQGRAGDNGEEPNPGGLPGRDKKFHWEAEASVDTWLREVSLERDIWALGKATTTLVCKQHLLIITKIGLVHLEHVINCFQFHSLHQIYGFSHSNLI